MMIRASAAEQYFATPGKSLAQRPAHLPEGPQRTTRATPPRLAAIAGLTDEVGIVRHAVLAAPNREHRYRLEDNCRALMLMHRFDDADSVAADAMAMTYAAFVQHAWIPDAGHFRSHLGYDRRWLDIEEPHDGLGRALWSLGDTALRARNGDVRTWAAHLFGQVASHAIREASPRSLAFCILGCDAMLDACPEDVPTCGLLGELAGRLLAEHLKARRPDWIWFEAALADDNSRLPQALIRAGRRLGNAVMLQAGVASLTWITRSQTSSARLREVSADGSGSHCVEPMSFDRRPVEMWATLDAASDALICTGAPGWTLVAQDALDWFAEADNADLAVGVAADSGVLGPLVPGRVDRDHGTDAVLAFQFVACAVRDMLRMAKVAATSQPS